MVKTAAACCAIMISMKKDVATKEAIKQIAEDIAIYILKLNITSISSTRDST